MTRKYLRSRIKEYDKCDTIEEEHGRENFTEYLRYGSFMIRGMYNTSRITSFILNR